MGCQVIGTDYQYSSRIFAYEVPDAYKSPSFLNVVLLEKKIEKTPSSYIYEFDGDAERLQK